MHIISIIEQQMAKNPPNSARQYLQDFPRGLELQGRRTTHLEVTNVSHPREIRQSVYLTYQILSPSSHPHVFRLQFFAV